MVLATRSVWLPDETIIDGLPPEMHDIAPRGFLGRSYVRHHGDLGLPEDVTNWSDNHILIALSRRGEDLLGNLVVGRESFDRFQNLQHETHTANDFPELSNESLQRIALLDAYGALIANTDRHQQNVALFPAEGGYSVAPAFDQLPMAYAPPASGNLRHDVISEPHAAVNTLVVWDEARGLAGEFWQRASEQQLSDSMRAIVAEHANR